MNATVRGLYQGIDAMDDHPGSPEAERDAQNLISQAAGIVLLCSLAQDAVVAEDGEEYVQDVADVTSRLLVDCYDNLVIALNLLG